MAAPDKIYITEYNTNVETGYFSRNKDDVFTQEYIRKDALIEWTNKMLQDTADRLDFHSNQAFAQLFDKLNSM